VQAPVPQGPTSDGSSQVLDMAFVIVDVDLIVDQSVDPER
jgi:hypothetical protein